MFGLARGEPRRSNHVEINLFKYETPCLVYYSQINYLEFNHTYKHKV